MKKIFESNKYNPIMFVSVIIVSLLILFSLINTLENKSSNNSHPITGNAISEVSSRNHIFYIILTIILLLIAITSWNLIKIFKVKKRKNEN